MKTSPCAPAPKSSSPSLLRPIGRRALPRETAGLARFLIGKILVSDLGGERTAGRIVEDEAYVTGDPASHAFRGETPRNATMFGPRGHAYVYFIYGMYWCLNVTGEVVGKGEGVLIRALEPLEGLETMRARRPRSAGRDLTRGPGRLCASLGVDGTADGLDLCTSGAELRLFDDGTRPKVAVSARIGLTRATERELRFYAKGSSWLSGPAALSR